MKTFHHVRQIIFQISRNQWVLFIDRLLLLLLTNSVWFNRTFRDFYSLSVECCFHSPISSPTANFYTQTKSWLTGILIKKIKKKYSDQERTQTNNIWLFSCCVCMRECISICPLFNSLLNVYLKANYVYSILLKRLAALWTCSLCSFWKGEIYSLFCMLSMWILKMCYALAIDN